MGEPSEEQVRSFCVELSALSRRHGVTVGGCGGCCGNPWLDAAEPGELGQGAYAAGDSSYGPAYRLRWDKGAPTPESPPEPGVMTAIDPITCASVSELRIARLEAALRLCLDALDDREHETSDNGDQWCKDCGVGPTEGHNIDCPWLQATQAAREALR